MASSDGLNPVTYINMLRGLDVLSSPKHFCGAGMLKTIIASLKDRIDLPIQVEEIAAAGVASGCTDIVYFKGVDGEDPAQIHGAFWHYTRRPNLYAEPDYIALIPFNLNDSLPWQRVTCCKEMVHIFDSELERTDRPDEVVDLLDRLLGRMSTDDFGVVDLMASKDKLALYYSLPLLMPKAALEAARRDIAEKRKTPADVAAQAGMPLGLTLLMLNSEWDTLNGQLERGA